MSGSVPADSGRREITNPPDWIFEYEYPSFWVLEVVTRECNPHQNDVRNFCLKALKPQYIFF